MSNAEARELASKIQQFLSHQIETDSGLSEAAKESLTVAAECIEQAYNVQKKAASDELVDIYRSHKRGPPQAAADRAAMPDPAQLVQNLAGSIFSSVLGGAAGGAAAAAAAANINQQQEPVASSQQATATDSSSSQTNASAPLRQRKRASEAELMVAESFKNQGNYFMRQEEYRKAHDCYTQAIDIDDNNAVYYSNRAAAAHKLGDYQSSISDCKEAIEIDPNYSKAYGRLGSAYDSLGDLQKAKDAYLKVVELDPANESNRHNLELIESKLAQANVATGGVGQTADTNIVNMVRSMMSNPEVMNMAMRSLSDPRVQGLISGLGGAAVAAATGGAPPSAPAQGDAENQHSRTSTTTTTASAPSAPQQQPQGDSASAAPPFANPLGNLSANFLAGTASTLLSSLSQNPELAENMRRLASGFANPNPNNSDRNPPPGYS